MRFSRILILVAGALLLASPSFAAADPANDWTKCSEDLTNWKEVVVVRPSNQSKICFEFDDTIDESGVINTVFNVVGGASSFCTSHDVRGLAGAMAPAPRGCGVCSHASSLFNCEKAVHSSLVNRQWSI